MENSKISWTHHTFNPWMGCTKVSEGCANCYAEHSMDHRFHLVQWGLSGTRVRTADANWKQPLKWNRDATKAGERHRVFCASLADVFEDRAELQPWRDHLWELIDKCGNLDWLLLTKRPENVKVMLRATSICGGETCEEFFEHFDNVWMGVSVENQAAADSRIPELLKIPARVRFLSVEPLLGSVDLCHVQYENTVEINCLTGAHGVYRPHRGKSDQKVDWVIVGGESGASARPMHGDWVRSLRDQCVNAGVAFHFKQWGNKDAGRLLDGREWNEFPTNHSKP